MKLKFNQMITIVIFFVISSNIKAQTLKEKFKQCISDKKASLQIPVTVDTISHKGCESASTRNNGTRRSCNASVCWGVDEIYKNNKDILRHGNLIILSAKILDHSASGSEHSFNPNPTYSPSGRPTEFCVTVHARSNRGYGAARGWQKVKANVTVKHDLNQNEIDKITDDCFNEFAGG